MLFKSQMKGHQVLRKKNKEKWNVLIYLPNILSLGLLKEWELLFILIKSIISLQRSFISDDGRSNRFNLMKLQIVIQNCVNTLFCKIQFLSSLGSYWFYIFHRNCANPHQENQLMLWYFVIWPSFCQTCKFHIPLQFKK